MGLMKRLRKLNRGGDPAAEAESSGVAGQSSSSSSSSSPVSELPGAVFCGSDTPTLDMAGSVRDGTLGATVGGEEYRQGRHIADGGMASIHAAVPAAPGGEPLALKSVRPDRPDAEEAGLEKEARSFQEVGPHKNILGVHGYGKDEAGRGAMVMDQATGGDGEHMIKRLQAAYDARKITHEEYWGTVTSIQRRVTEGLAHMGTANKVHGDLKEENILFDATGEPKLSDLGSATDIGAQADEVGVTPSINMTPDWVGTGRFDASNDMYAMGQMAHRAMTGDYKDRLPTAGMSKEDRDDAYVNDRYAQHQAATPAEPRRRDKMKAGIKGLFGRKPEDAQPSSSSSSSSMAAPPDQVRTGYSDFIDKTITPLPGDRLSPAAALEGSSYLDDGLLEDEQANGVVRRMNDEKDVDYGPKRSERELVAASAAGRDARIAGFQRENEAVASENPLPRAIEGAATLYDTAEPGVVRNRGARSAAVDGPPALTGSSSEAAPAFNPGRHLDARTAMIAQIKSTVAPVEAHEPSPAAEFPQGRPRAGAMRGPTPTKSSS